MSNKLRRLTIKNTIRTGRKQSEKGKLESQELQFFLSTSDNRLQRVKSGARLFHVITNKELNQKPIELIEHVLTKQSSTDPKLTAEEKRIREEEMRELLSGDIDMMAYLKQTNFDACQEILKEKNIQKFFKQKYNILMMYLEDNPQSVATVAPSVSLICIGNRNLQKAGCHLNKPSQNPQKLKRQMC